MIKKQPDCHFQPISTFSEEEKGHYLAGLIEGDGYFSPKGELSIAFHRKDRIAIENIITALDAGIMSDLKKEQTSKLRFNGKQLQKVIELINGKLVGTPKVIQLIESGCAAKFQIEVKPALLVIDVNTHWLAGFCDADGYVGISLSRPKTANGVEGVSVGITFCQKNRQLMDCIADCFSQKNVREQVFRDGRICFSVSFSSAKDFTFWRDYFAVYHLQSRKHWQFLKVSECFDLMKERQTGLVEKARRLQTESRAMEIPEEARSQVIPMFARRSSLTVEEMDQIDEYLANPTLTYKKIAEKMNITRHLLYRYKKTPDRYRSNPLVYAAFRRQNTRITGLSPGKELSI